MCRIGVNVQGVIDMKFLCFAYSLLTENTVTLTPLISHWL